MARFWGVCVLVLSSFLLIESVASLPVEEESSSSAIDFDTGYLIVAPKVFVAESVETICLSLQNMTGPLEVAIRLMDNYTAMAKLPIQFMEFKMACYDIEVPAIEYEMMHATLLVKMRRTLVTQSGFEVVERRTVTINGVNTEMFIETDKPVYKPGQTVKFRILNINQDLKPDVTPVSKIWIESPSGVRMQQWRNQESTDGLIDLEMPMTSDPVPGTWSIIATHKGRKTTRTFEVDEYVLPKFEVIITPPTYVMINTTNIRVKICGRYTYGQPVRGSFVARITVKSTGWNFRERKTITRRVDDTGPSGCNEFPADLSRLELNSTDFSLWNARLSVDVEYTEASTGVMLEANSESSQITRDALKLQFDSPNIFKPGVPYYGKIFVTHPDGSPAAGKLISLSCNTDQGQIFDKNLTSPENGAIEFTVTDINITSTSLNLYAHAPGFNIPRPEMHGRQHVYTLHDPATSHYARPQYSPSGSFLQMAPIRGVAAVGSEQTLRIDFTANDPEENPRFRFVVMSRGNIIPTRFYRGHKRPKRQAGDSAGSSESGPSMSEPDGSVEGLPSMDGVPSVLGGPSEMGSLDIPSFIPSVLGGSSFSSDFSFVPPTDAPVIIVEPGEVYSRELYFRVTPDMVPETRILAYYVRTDGEVVADSSAFRVQKKFENEVDIAFSDEERMPGAETQIMIHASPGSLCAVGVVDRSVHILGGDNQLKADKIFASLDKYQLTSSGGYIDPSTHCVPEEDEYPQFFPLGRKKRGIFLPGYGARYQDSSRAFKDMGLLFITNMDVETSPCVGGASVSRGTAEVENAAEGPIAVPLLNKEDAVFDDGGILEKPEVPNDVLETAPRIRSYFPETWLWDLRRTDSVTGETSISMEVPDTVTEWIGSGFCTSVEYGVGVSPPTKLRAFQPFFLSYTLPYSVVRGEVVPVTVTVFNYLTESLVVEVSLELNEGFRMARKSRPRKKVCVGGSQSQSVEFRIQPRKLGNIALQALGLSVNDQDALCGNELVSSSIGARDSIFKELLVEAEGTEVDTTQNCYFCPEEAAQSQKTALFQNAAVNWESEYNPNAMSNLDITMTLTPDTGSDTIQGRNLWRMGVYASDSPQGTGTKYAYQQNILDQTAMQTPSRRDRDLVLRGRTPFDLRQVCEIRNKHPYLCVEMARNAASSTSFTVPIRGGIIKTCSAYSCKVAARYTRLEGGVSFPESGTLLDATVTIHPAPNTNEITGDGLWKVSAFGSRNGQGTGYRNGEVRVDLDRRSLRASLRPGNSMSLTGTFDFPNVAYLGCRDDYSYLCLEFAKGDRPSMTFDMQPSIMCHEQRCTRTDRPTSTGGSNDPVASYTNMGVRVEYPNDGTRLSASLSITPASDTARIVGDGLWRVSAFGSRNAQGTGNRNGEVPDILDRQSLRAVMESGRTMELTGEFDFPNIADLGCSNDYRYLCFEFAKGDRPSMRFTMQSNVMCPQQNCRPDPSTGGGGNTGGNTGGNRLREARYTNVEPDVTIPTRGTRVRANLRVTPDSDTDLIGGDGLWRVAAFGSSNSHGQGQRSGEVSDILDYLARRKTLQPPRRGDDNIMELSGSFSFPNVADLGCSNAYRYLCFEFDKGESPSPDFTMRSSIRCTNPPCVGGSSGGTGGSGSSGGSGGSGRPTGGGSGSNTDKTVTIRTLAWAYDPQSSSSIDASVNLDVSPGSNFDGTNLWRLGLFASDSSRGTGRREDERRQILNMDDRSRPIVSGRSNSFTASAGLEIRGLGCEGKRYLCLEFGKGSRPNPPYTIQNRNMQGETEISCKIQQCNEESKIRVNSVKVIPADDTQIREGERNEVEFDVVVKYDPADSTSIRGRSLWKVQTWGARTGGDVNPKISAVDQVLSSFQQDTMVEKRSGTDFRFQRLSHTFDMTGRKCQEMKFICVRLQKQNPTPDFLLMSRNDDPNRLMGCVKVRCAGAAKPMFTVSNIGIVRDPFSAGRAGQNNPMTLDINVNYDRGTTTDIGGDPQWAVEAWGSAKKNGKGRKVSPSRLQLGFEAQQTFTLGGVLRFNDRPYDFDLTNKECQKTKFLCIKLSKTGAGFTLKGKPNSKALTKCTPYTCLPGEGSAGSNPSGGGGGGAGGAGNGHPQVTILGFAPRFDRFTFQDGRDPITMHAEITSSPESGVPSGPNLWHIAVYGNSRSDGSDPDKLGYTGNVLTPKKAKSRLNPGGVMAINDIRFQFDMNEIGCYPYNYLCLEYGKGTSDSYDMRYPPGGRAVVCTLRECPTKK